MTMIGVFATHPIQYQVPIWRGLAALPDADLTVFYFSDRSVRGGHDPEFGRNIAWDVDLLGGYRSTFLARDADLSKPNRMRLHSSNLKELGRFDWVCINGYTHGFERQLVSLKRQNNYRVFIRGEFSDEGRGKPEGLSNGARSLARRLYLRWLYSRVDAFGVVGVAARRHLERAGVELSRTFSSPYCIDTAALEAQVQSNDRLAARHRLGIAASSVVILFSGKLVPWKAPLLLGEAVLGLPDDAVLLYVGDGPLLPEIERRLRPGLQQRLILPGFINQSALGSFYAAADIFVLPSERDTWGLAVNEAQQFALPVVVSDRVGCRHDLVVEGETGFVFPYGDVEALGTRLRQLMMSRGLRESLGATGRRRVVASYTPEAAVKGIATAMGLRSHTAAARPHEPER
jgi:glycosyltransferase involved in cell wall biosynthesis